MGFYRQLASLILQENTSSDLDMDKVVEHFRVAFYDPRQVSAASRTQMHQWFGKYRQRVFDAFMQFVTLRIHRLDFRQVG